MPRNWSVPRLWPGETVVVAASGASLTQAQVDYCRGKARFVAVSDVYRLAPWADLLYSCDGKWWRRHMRHLGGFAGLMVGLDDSIEFPRVHILRYDPPPDGGETGFTDDPRKVRTGANSGYQAVHVAAHAGAAKIVLIGFDMKGTHFFGDHPPGLHVASPFDRWIKNFRTLAAELARRGVRVVNATPGSALDAFPVEHLERAL